MPLDVECVKPQLQEVKSRILWAGTGGEGGVASFTPSERDRVKTDTPAVVDVDIRDHAATGGAGASAGDGTGADAAPGGAVPAEDSAEAEVTAAAVVAAARGSPEGDAGCFQS